MVTKGKSDLITIVERWLKTVRLNKIWKVERDGGGNGYISFLTPHLGHITGVVTFVIEDQAISRSMGFWTGLNPFRLEAADPEFFPKLRELLNVSAEAAQKEVVSWDVKPPRAYPWS